MADLYQSLVEQHDRLAPSVWPIRYQTVGKIVGALDYLLIVAACVVAAATYSYVSQSQTIGDVGAYIGVGLICATIFVLLSRSLYCATALTSFSGQVRGILFNWIIVLLIICLMLFLLKLGAHYSRGVLLLFSILGIGVLGGSRLVISSQLRKALTQGTLDGTPAIVIGDSASLAGLSHLQNIGVREICRFEVPDAAESQGDLFAVVDRAITAARANAANCVLLALRWDDERRRELVCERLQVLPVRVFLLPDQIVSSLLLQRAQNLGENFTVELQRPPLSASELALKRTSDLVLAGALLVLLCPLLIIVSLLIKIDSPGPAIFRQRRQGFNGSVFSIYKFRTMNVLEDGNVIRQARRNDVRVTRVGRILRATSMDELPQLINVINGQMSLVGPRPHALAHDNKYTKLISNYGFRQHVKPGLTGWAQIHGFRGETARLKLMEQRVSLDLWYIRNWSIWLDLRIIVLTGVELIRRRDAY